MKIFCVPYMHIGLAGRGRKRAEGWELTKWKKIGTGGKLGKRGGTFHSRPSHGVGSCTSFLGKMDSVDHCIIDEQIISNY